MCELQRRPNPCRSLAERIDTVPRTIDSETYHIWTQKRDASRLGKVKLLITEKESRDQGDEASVKYIVSNRIDVPASHLIGMYAMRWRVGTFFRATKQDLGLEVCELRYPAGVKLAPAPADVGLQPPEARHCRQHSGNHIFTSTIVRDRPHGRNRLIEDLREDRHARRFRSLKDGYGRRSGRQT